LLDLGLEPHPMTDDVLAEMIEVVQSHRGRIEDRHILPDVRWRH
jgi:UDP-sulfoquinovose synthase